MTTAAQHTASQASRELQQAREAADLARHKSRLQWLTKGRPCWADGTPVDAHTRHALERQSRAALAEGHEGGAEAPGCPEVCPSRLIRSR